MPVSWVPLYIEPAIQAGLDSGQLVQFAGVVRDNSGHIVKHLPKVTDVALEKAKNLAPQAKKLAAGAKNPVVLGGAAAVAVVGAAAVGTAALVDRRRHALEHGLNKALTSYLTSAQQQNLAPKEIRHAIEALDKLTAAKPGLTATDLGIDGLAVSIDDFTQRLATANPSHAITPAGNQADSLAQLRANLAYQLTLLEPPKELPPA